MAVMSAAGTESESGRLLEEGTAIALHIAVIALAFRVARGAVGASIVCERVGLSVLGIHEVSAHNKPDSKPRVNPS